jgi:iron complex transport system substrate-binding protein
VRQLSHLSSEEIDAMVQQARANNNPVHWIDGDLLRDLQPDLILTQELCQVCAIGSGSVFETAARVLDRQPEIISMRPACLEDIFQNIRRIGRAAGVPERAEVLVTGLRRRVDVVVKGLDGLAERPKVFCMDWIDPLRNTGQWTPELVALAGGVEGLAEMSGVSREVGWDEVLAYQPDYLMVMPCAFNMERTVLEARQHLAGQPTWERLKGVQEHRVYLFDGQIPSRPGPRVLDVLEGLAEAMHPERFAGLAPPGVFQKAGTKGDDAGPAPQSMISPGTA